MSFHWWTDEQIAIDPYNGILLSNERSKLLIQATEMNLKCIVLCGRSQVQKLHSVVFWKWPKKKMISRGWSQRKDWRQTWHIWKEIKLFCILIVVFVCLSKFTQLCITRTKFCLHENSTSIEVFKLFNVLWFHLFFLHILDSSLADFLPLPTVTSHPYLQLLAVLLAPPVASWLNSCFC
jgi:hypothetical protein